MQHIVMYKIEFQNDFQILSEAKYLLVVKNLGFQLFKT